MPALFKSILSIRWVTMLEMTRRNVRNKACSKLWNGITVITRDTCHNVSELLVAAAGLISVSGIHRVKASLSVEVGKFDGFHHLIHTCLSIWWTGAEHVRRITLPWIHSSLQSFEHIQEESVIS
jgi:hypothetical protein